MRRILSVVTALTLAICLMPTASLSVSGEAVCEGVPLCAEATNNAIVVSNSTEQPDAHLVHPAVYKIAGNNYCKLRDVAMMLNGSGKQFAVDYDDAAKAVFISTGRPYAAIGGELTGAASKTASASPTNNGILIDGEPATLTVYKIDGANYFKLRDLGKALDFHVGYDDGTKTVYISGASGYEEETGSEQIPFEAQIIRTNGYHDGAEYPKVTLADSAEELNRYYEEYQDLYDFSHKETVYSDTTIGFADAIDRYDSAWFADHQLIVVLLEEGSGSVRHRVAEVKGGTAPEVSISRMVPEVGTDDMAQWHILIEVERIFDPAAEITANLLTPQEREFIAD